VVQMSTPLLVLWLAICGLAVWLAIDAKRWRAGCDLSWRMWGQRAPEWFVRWTRPVFLVAFAFAAVSATVTWLGG
jgi:hypothetical protein